MGLTSILLSCLEGEERDSTEEETLEYWLSEAGDLTLVNILPTYLQGLSGKGRWTLLSRILSLPASAVRARPLSMFVPNLDSSSRGYIVKEVLISRGEDLIVSEELDGFFALNSISPYLSKEQVTWVLGTSRIRDRADRMIMTSAYVKEAKTDSDRKVHAALKPTFYGNARAEYWSSLRAHMNEKVDRRRARLRFRRHDAWDNTEIRELLEPRDEEEYLSGLSAVSLKEEEEERRRFDGSSGALVSHLRIVYSGV